MKVTAQAPVKQVGDKSQKQVNAFLDDVSRAFQGHDWGRLVKMFDPEVVSTQRSLGVKDPQFIAEALQLDFDARPGWGGGKINEGHLNRIQSLSIDRASAEPDAAGLVSYRGTATLKDGTTKPVELMLQQNDQGRYELTCAVG